MAERIRISERRVVPQVTALAASARKNMRAAALGFVHGCLQYCGTQRDNSSGEAAAVSSVLFVLHAPDSNLAERRHFDKLVHCASSSRRGAKIFLHSVVHFLGQPTMHISSELESWHHYYRRCQEGQTPESLFKTENRLPCDEAYSSDVPSTSVKEFPEDRAKGDLCNCAPQACD